MTPLPILDLIAGLIFIYFLLAIINNSFFELFAALFKLRAYYLKDWLITTFSNKTKTATLAQEIMDHPLLSGLTKNGKATTYMNAKSFAPAFIEIIFTNFHPEGTVFTLQNIRTAIAGTTILPLTLKNVFLFFIDKTNAAQVVAKATNTSINELEHFENQVSNWFDSIMERVGSKFKRNTLVFTTIFATIITLSLNIDSISMANYLYSNPEARQKCAATAYASISDSTTIKRVEKIRANNLMMKKEGANNASIDSTNKSIDNFLTEVKQQKELIASTMGTLNANLPIGWTKEEEKSFRSSPIKKLGGWLMTIMAICLGAPFWFDVLSKVANIRSSLKPNVANPEVKDKK